MNVAAIILAAGASSRLGSPKQLIQYNGEALLARAIRIALEAGFDPVIAVLGAERESIRAAVDNTGAVFVDNDLWQDGIASSIHAGIRALDQTSQAVLIMSCDQPKLSADHLHRLLDTFASQPQPAITASFYAGVRGVPAVFPAGAFPYLMQLSGDAGARKLLVNPPCPVIEIPCAGGEIDIDTPEDLAHLQ
jgi:molybdenum cofactor cytidylyltransferase